MIADILVPAPLMDMLDHPLRQNFKVHELWAQDNPDDYINYQTPLIKGIVTAGHGVIDAGLIDRLPNLEIIANFGVGYDTVDAHYAAKRSVMVTHTPDVLTEEVADAALGLIIMTVRELAQAERWLRAGYWVSKGAYPLTAGSLRGRVAGIAGFGRIGKAIARRLEAANVQVVYHGRRQQAAVANQFYDNLCDMAAAVDILINVLPGGDVTHHLIGSDIFQALGPKGIFINVGRGASVDEQALIEALQNKIIFSAGLDVYAHEPNVPDALCAMDNVVLLPHVASASIDTRQAMADLVIDNLISWFEKKQAITPVPETRDIHQL